MKILEQTSRILDKLRAEGEKAALAELRTFNLTGAEGFLMRTKRINADDEEVDRILDFISEYKARPVDMRLEIFIKNLKTR